MHIISTIIPIFAIIILGWFARRKGFIQPEFLGPANRLVYHLAIPVNSSDLHKKAERQYLTLRLASGDQAPAAIPE